MPLAAVQAHWPFREPDATVPSFRRVQGRGRCAAGAAILGDEVFMHNAPVFFARFYFFNAYLHSTSLEWPRPEKSNQSLVSFR
jgi:hypothetical protein